MTGDAAGVPPELRALAEAMARPGYRRWRTMAERVGGCEQPIRLVGQSIRFDKDTGEVLSEFRTDETAPGYLLVPCGNRRATRCEPCSRTYKADTYHLVRAGLIGGKGVPDDVRRYPRLFVTLTAPSFGAVHSRGVGRDGRVRPCRPRRGATNCIHDVPSACMARHEPADPLLGQPLCADCYDYPSAVLWNAHVGDLWRRTTIYLRAELAKQAGLSRKALGERLRISYAKVAEFQARGLVHFHVVVRVDGPDGPSSPAPAWADLAFLESAMRAAVPASSVRTEIGGTAHRFRWGGQLDIRPVMADDGQRAVSEQAVSAYVAKYATKAAEVTGTVDRRIRSHREIAALDVCRHVRRMITTAWTLGGNPAYRHLQLRRWAHMLGYRGHFSTKSRVYSTTLGALRKVRSDYRAREQATEAGWPAPEETGAVGGWTYTGQGYLAEGEALIASEIREARRVHRSQGRPPDAA